MTKCRKRNERRSRTLRILYYWGKLTGINAFTLTKSGEIKFSYSSVIYALFLSSAYLYMLKLIVRERIGMVLPGETPLGLIVDAFILLFASIENFSIWLSSAFHQKRAKAIINGLVTIERISRELNLHEDYEKMFRKLGILLAIVNILYAIWAITISWCSPSDKIAWLIFPILGMISYNTVTLFIWMVDLVGKKFRRLNDKVAKLMDHENADKLHDPETLEFARDSRIFRHGQKRNGRLILPLEKLDAISRLHRELRDVMSLIMDHFALIILMKMLKQFLLLFLDVHIIYRYLIACESFNADNLIYVTHIALWAIVPLSLVTIISHVCGSTANEANAAGNIFHGVANDLKVSSDTREIAQSHVLSLDLLTNRVKISLFGLIELNNFFVYNTIATATSYLTIMLQFDD